MAFMRLHLFRAGKAWAGSRLFRDEQGIALILAIAAMLVLTLILSAVIFLTSSSARDAHRTNAGQKAYNLAQSGISSGLSVLFSNYPTSSFKFPGDFSLITGSASGEAHCTGTSPRRRPPSGATRPSPRATSTGRARSTRIPPRRATDGSTSGT